MQGSRSLEAERASKRGVSLLSVIRVALSIRKAGTAAL
jgi:hypothetical protein